MPALEVYGAKLPIELIRQSMIFKSWYDRKAIRWTETGSQCQHYEPELDVKPRQGSCSTEMSVTTQSCTEYGSPPITGGRLNGLHSMQYAAKYQMKSNEKTSTPVYAKINRARNTYEQTREQNLVLPNGQISTKGYQPSNGYVNAGQTNLHSADKMVNGYTGFLKRTKMAGIDSVQKWLNDLRFMTEPECMSVLQGKSISGTNNSVEPLVMAAKSTKDSIDAIRNRASVISAEFAKVFKKIQKDRWKHLKSAAVRICSQLRSLLHEINTCIHDMPPYLFEEEASIMEECAKLSQYIESFGMNNGNKPDTQPVVNSLTELGKSFSAVVDMALGFLVQTMVQTIEESNSPYCIRSTISHIISLGLEGEHMCYLIAREGGIRALLDLCRDQSVSQTHSQSLRAIATVCCVAESVSELEKSGGVECLTDILCNVSLGESMRSEAAGVIAQITSPCLDHYQHITGFIENLEDLIRALLDLCVQASTHEVFLLATAAMANITFMDSMAVDFLASYDAARSILQSCHQNKAESMFAKDQVATILANMSVLDTCVQEIKDNDGIQLLLGYLTLRPFHNSEAEIAASERVLQKAAIAITRLCRMPENATNIVQHKGIPLLVNLCRNVKARNNSDGVLIACLAALRKISVLIGTDSFSAVDIQQLVKPSLIDSYLICSQMVESFV